MTDPFNLFFSFYSLVNPPYFLMWSLVPPVINLHAKFEVSSSKRSLDMEGVPKFKKVDHVISYGPSLTSFYIFGYCLR